MTNSSSLPQKSGPLLEIYPPPPKKKEFWGNHRTPLPPPPIYKSCASMSSTTNWILKFFCFGWISRPEKCSSIYIRKVFFSYKIKIKMKNEIESEKGHLCFVWKVLILPFLVITTRVFFKTELHLNFHFKESFYV